MSVPTLTYPRLGISPDDVFTQETFEKLTAYLFSWQQAPGAFGGLHLHPCWNETSSLTRRYHGQTAFFSLFLIDGVLRLHEVTGDKRWEKMAHQIVENLLFLQATEGGFIHASAEFEPTYTCQETCPIHQFIPVQTLLRYAEWEGARTELREEVREAIDRHWQWFQGEWWMRGNGWQQPLQLPGWCGVTNQDLVVVAALAWYGRVFGDHSRYEEFGKPVLDAYLSPAYYHKKLGLFERGDKPNFVERTNYYDIILDALEIIHACTADERIPPVIENIILNFEGAVFQTPDGLIHLAWGADTDPVDKTRILGWRREQIVMAAYPAHLVHLRRFLKHHDSPVIQALTGGLEKTLAAYTYADGTIPGSLGKNSLLSIVPGSDVLRYWLFLIHYLGTSLKSPTRREAVRIIRKTGTLEWATNHRLWQISEDGIRQFGGLKNNPGALSVGPEEVLPGADFSTLQHAEYLEILQDSHRRQ